MQVFNSKSGSAIVEAATVFPLIIVSVTALIFMMSYFYGQLNERVDMHIVLRAESGKMCENVFYINDVSDGFTVYKKSQQVYSSSTVNSKRNLLLKKREKKIEARKYLIDECRFVRIAGIAENENITEE